MKFSKMQGGLIAGLFLAASVLTGCGGGGNSERIVYLNHDGDDLVGGQMMRDYIIDRAKPKGFNIEVFDAKGDGNAQFDYMKTALEEGAQAIILIAIDNDSIMPLVKQANAQGIPIITINRDISDGERINVGCDEYEAGKLQAEYMLKNLPQGATVVYLEGMASLNIARLRWEGFKQECLDKRSDLKLLDMQDSKWSKAEAMKIMSLWLSIFPKIDAVVCGNDQMAMGAVEALKAAGRLKGCHVAGVDATDDALKAIANGEMVQTIKQDIGKQADGVVETLEKIRSGSKPTKITIPFTSVTKENLSQFK
ncbi:MAG: sugar ABC transporter substrate-binding protein [Selenomonadaceae bacterium]|nr:sugar ABC transporter substrate-binding protein [Selenomonadaceae bacterium]